MAHGSLIDGYRIERVIGSGGFGEVYAAIGPGDEPVALKVLHRELCEDPALVARFEREIETTGELAHPNIVRILARGRTDTGQPYFVMERLHGIELSEHLRDRGRLPPQRCLELLAPVCDALAAAHACGIVHRDIKASNVFLRDDGGITLLDFGIAKIIARPGMSLTRTRQIIGTPSAMAPEQISGGTVGPRTDVYALGALAFEMLSGKPVFDATSSTLMQHLHRHASRPRLSERVPVSPAVDAVVHRALAVDPEQRPGGALSFLSELERALTGRVAATVREVEIVLVIATVTGCDDLAAAAAQLRRARDELDSAGFRQVRPLACGFVVALELAECEDRALDAIDRARARLSGVIELEVGRGRARVVADRYLGGEVFSKLAGAA